MSLGKTCPKCGKLIASQFSDARPDQIKAYCCDGNCKAMNQNKPVTNEERAESCLKGIRNSANSYNSDELIYFNKEASLQQIKYYLDNLQKEIEERFKSKLSANPNDWPEVKLQEKCDELEIKLFQREGEIERLKESYADSLAANLAVSKVMEMMRHPKFFIQDSGPFNSAIHVICDEIEHSWKDLKIIVPEEVKELQTRLSSHQALMERLRARFEFIAVNDECKCKAINCVVCIAKDALDKLNELREG